MTHPSTVADTLDAAADLLSKPGVWRQDIFYREGDCFCLIGAVREAAGLHSASDVENGPLGDAIRDVLVGVDDEYNLIYEWNDADGRTQDEVVAKLREAAAKARGEVQP